MLPFRRPTRTWPSRALLGAALATYAGGASGQIQEPYRWNFFFTPNLSIGADFTL